MAPHRWSQEGRAELSCKVVKLKDGRKRILIVDDEKLVRWALNQKCSEFGFACIEAETGQAGLQALQTESVDAILLDVHLPDMSGIQVLEKLKHAGETRSVIMMTADPQLDDVKTALRLGAYDFVSKPINFDELNITLQNALEAGSLRTEVESLRDEVRRRAGYHDVIGVSRKITELMKFVYKVASSAATTILIQGESGTGKDLVAKAIHYRSSRSERPFVAINCSAIPETLMEAELFGHEKGAFTDAKAMKKGLFEVADGGTLFLDELVSSPRSFKRNYSAFWKIRSFAVSAAFETFRLKYASLPLPTGILSAKFAKGASGRTFTTAWQLSPSSCRHFASARKTSLPSWSSSSLITIRNSERLSRESATIHVDCFRTMTGPVTFASSRTPLSAP